MDRTGIEAHSSLGVGERCHQLLRQTYRKIMVDHPTADSETSFAFSVKAMNDTHGPEGLVPSALVFGELLKAYTTSETPDERAVLASRAKLAHCKGADGEAHG